MRPAGVRWGWIDPDWLGDLDEAPGVARIVVNESMPEVEDVHACVTVEGLFDRKRRFDFEWVGFRSGVASELAGHASSAACPPLTQPSTSEAKNFHRRPSLWAGIFFRVIHL